MGKNNVVKTDDMDENELSKINEKKNLVVQKAKEFVKKHLFTMICLVVIAALSVFIYKIKDGNTKMIEEVKESAFNQGKSEGVEEGINKQKAEDEEARKLEMETTKLDFTDLGLLVTQESNITKVSNYKDDNKKKVFSIEFSVPFSTVQQIYSYDVQICAGIDFTQVSYVIDDDNKIIVVTLPEVQTISKALDNDSFELYYEKESAFKKVTITEINDNQNKLVDEAEETAITKGLYDKAEKNAETIVKNIIRQFSKYEDYNIKFVTEK